MLFNYLNINQLWGHNRKIPGEKNSERENLWPKKILCPKIPAEKIFRLKKSGLKNF
jgi:hypothetical protein